MRWDNTPEEFDGGPCPDVAVTIAEFLRGTRWGIRSVIEGRFNFQPLPDLMQAVEKLVQKCTDCELWLATNEDRERCVCCAEKHAVYVAALEWIPSKDDLEFLKTLGAAEPDPKQPVDPRSPQEIEEDDLAFIARWRKRETKLS
jgi:hypothetical protein